MNKLILLALLFAFASASKSGILSSLWETWKVHHKKVYSTMEEQLRFGIFVENYSKINRLNAEHHDVKFGLNQFADLTQYEFGLHHASGILVDQSKEVKQKEAVILPIENLPSSVDWRNRGAVTAVGDQYQCGSCWAFSTLGLLEAFYFIKNGKLIAFSEQQLLDCDTDDYGCMGGYPSSAVAYAAKYGLESDADYPYTGTSGKCAYDKSKAYNVTSVLQNVTVKDTDQFKAALVNSPVAVVIDASSEPFQFYKSGVITKNCTNKNPNHSALAVGYHTYDLYEAFIVKNSWGTSWGMDGYVLIGTSQKENNGEGVCGILSTPQIVTSL